MISQVQLDLAQVLIKIAGSAGTYTLSKAVIDPKVASPTLKLTAQPLFKITECFRDEKDPLISCRGTKGSDKIKIKTSLNYEHEIDVERDDQEKATGVVTRKESLKSLDFDVRRLSGIEDGENVWTKNDVDSTTFKMKAATCTAN